MIYSQTTLEDDYLFPKIADFGLSKVVHSNSESASLQSTVGFKGTPIYVDSEYTKEGDVYSFAIIVYELLTLNQRFQDFSMMMMCKKVAIEGVRPEFTFKIDDCYRELIEKCWSQNPKDRPTFDEIVNELKTNEDFITDIVDRDEFQDYIELLDSLGNSFDKSKKFEKITISQNIIDFKNYQEKIIKLQNNIKKLIKQILDDQSINKKKN